MLTSTRIQRRQSEIRQALAELSATENPSEDELRSIDTLDSEYRFNEARYRAALIAEDDERRAAGAELEDKPAREWGALCAQYEMRQVALALDEGRTLDGATAEVVSELRSRGGFRGVPVPWEALEVRTGETVAGGTPNPITTRPIIDRLFPSSVAAQIGGSMVNIGTGEAEWPVTTSAVTVGWQATETGDVAGPTVYATTDRPLKSDHTLGVTMKITRRALKQSGAALEAAVRRDMNGAMASAMDRAVTLGSGSSGEPTGILAGASGWGITSTAVDATASWGAFRAAAVRFMTANAATGPGAVSALIRPEVFDTLDAALAGDGHYLREFDMLSNRFGRVVLTSNALAAPAGDPLATTAILTTSAGGVPPFYVGTWGAIDVIRDPYSDAASGGLRITALGTMDVTISRAEQIEILTGLR